MANEIKTASSDEPAARLIAYIEEARNYIPK